MKKQVMLVGLGLVLAASGCATHKISYKNPSAQATGPVHEEKQAFFLWGLAGGSDVDLAKLCPGGVASIESKTSAGDNILHWVTAGLYSPMTVAMQCAASAVATGGGQ